MLERLAPAALAAMLLGLALTGTVPAEAQTTTEAAAEKPAAAAAQPGLARSDPAGDDPQARQLRRLLQHRRPPSPSRRHRRPSIRWSPRCAGSSPSRPRGNVERADRAALAAFYARAQASRCCG